MKKQISFIALSAFALAFASCGEETPPEPGKTYKLEVDPQSLTFVAENAEAQTVTVTAENIEWTAELNDETTEWLHIEKKDGAVSVTVDDNAGTTERNAKFTIVSDNPGEAPSVEITVKQSGAEPIVPSLEADPLSLDFDADGGTKPVTVTANVEWDAEVVEGGNWLSFTKTETGINVAATLNMSTAERTGKITLSAEGVDDVTITATQDAGEEDFPNTIQYVNGEYRGDYGFGNGYMYQINFSDGFIDQITGHVSPETTFSFGLTIYSDEPEPMAYEVNLPVGEYTLVPFAEGEVHNFVAVLSPIYGQPFTHATSILFYENGVMSGIKYITAGSFTVERHNDNTLIKFNGLELSDGTTFTDSFYGRPTLINKSTFSTLTGDFDFGTISGGNSVSFFIDDIFGNGINYWANYLCGDGVSLDLNTGYLTGTGKALLVELYSDQSGTEMIPAGTYTLDSSQDTFTAFPGQLDNSINVGAWYIELNNDVYGPPAGNWAPLRTGDITITHTGAGIYTIEFDTLDVAGNKVTGKYFGTTTIIQ